MQPTDPMRRNTLKLMLASGLAASGWPFAAHADQQPMLMREIPGSGESIPAVGLGSSGAFETRSSQDLMPLKQVLRQFIELGGTVIDTSPTYGNAEAVIGKLVSDFGIADELFMATKVHERGRQAGIEQMGGSEQRLKKRPLDLMQVHNLIDVDTQLDTLRRWKADGRIRYLGITHYLVRAFDELERVIQHNDDLDFLQLNYSVMTPQAEKRLLPMAADKGIATLINRPFNDGRLFRATRDKSLPRWASEFDCNSWAQFSLKYILANPAVTCAIPATSDPQHLADNMGAGRGELPAEAMRSRMRKLASEL